MKSDLSVYNTRGTEVNGIYFETPVTYGYYRSLKYIKIFVICTKRLMNTKLMNLSEYSRAFIACCARRSNYKNNSISLNKLNMADL